jgi:hypothetical protein
MLTCLKTDLYSEYADDVALALELETDPEVHSMDTPWRARPSKRSPLMAAFAREFDLNWRSTRQFAYYSTLLVVFSLFGTNTAAASSFLLAMVPVWHARTTHSTYVLFLLRPSSLSLMFL